MNMNSIRFRRARGTSSGGLRGFTILEVLIGVGILTIGLLGIFMLQLTAIATNRSSYDIRIATELAETTIERLKRDSTMWQGDGMWEGGTWLDSALTCTSPGFTSDGAPLCAPPRPDGATVEPTYNDMMLPRATSGVLPAGQARFAEKNSRYCVHYATRWVVPSSLAVVQVRVSWPRNSDGEAAVLGDCARMNSISRSDFNRNFYAVSLTGMVRQNTL